MPSGEVVSHRGEVVSGATAELFEGGRESMR